MKTVNLFPRVILFSVFVVSSVSCLKSSYIDSDEPTVFKFSPGATKTETNASVWAEDLQMFLFPCEDKYRLSFFQNAYNKISRDSSTLKPTHMAVKIHPQSVVQQRSIEQNEQLLVRYIPFGYEGYNFSPQETNDFQRDNQAELVEDNCVDINAQVNVNIPYLYVYWPVTIEIPDSLSCEPVYPAFIPSFANKSGNNLSYDILSSLEREVLGQTTSSSGNRLCQLTVWDDLIEEYVPVPGARIEIHPASTYTDTTDSNGYFSIPSGLTSGYVYARLQSSNWIITLNNSTGAAISCLGATSTIDSSDADVVQIQLSASAALFAHRAAFEFYNDIHEFSCWEPRNFNRISISVVDTLTSGGRFYCHANPPYIHIQPGSGHSRFFTTLHELGHYAHYCRIGSTNFVSYWDSTEWYKLITESFASTVSWQIGGDYYLSIGYTPTYYFFTNQDRQRWSYLSDSRYSPLFTDIVDNYNQRNVNSAYLDDPFYFTAGYYIIRGIIDDCVSFQSVCDRIKSYTPVIGGDAIDDYLDCYNYWRLHN